MLLSAVVTAERPLSSTRTQVGTARRVMRGEETFDGGDHGGAASGEGRVRGPFHRYGAGLGPGRPCGGDLVDQGEDVDRVPCRIEPTRPLWVRRS